MFRGPQHPQRRGRGRHGACKGPQTSGNFFVEKLLKLLLHFRDSRVFVQIKPEHKAASQRSRSGSRDLCLAGGGAQGH